MKRVLLLCGYSNTETTAVLVNNPADFSFENFPWRTKDNCTLPVEPGVHYLGSSERFHFSSDVIAYVEDESGIVVADGEEILLTHLWDKYSEEERYEYN